MDDQLHSDAASVAEPSLAGPVVARPSPGVVPQPWHNDGLSCGENRVHLRHNNVSAIICMIVFKLPGSWRKSMIRM